MGKISWAQTNTFVNNKITEIKTILGTLQGDWLKFFLALGIVENSGSYNDSSLPYVGKYQVGEEILSDLDFFRRDGRWLGIYDLISLGDGTNPRSKIAQEIIVLKEFSGLNSPAASKYLQVRGEINKLNNKLI